MRSIIGDPSKQMGPPEVSGDAHVGFLATEVTCKGEIVVLVENPRAQVCVVGYNDACMVGIA